MAAIRELSGYPLGFPSEGKLQIWKFTREGSEGLRFDFNFNPVLDLCSPASAFRFFFDRLGEVDSGVGEEIVGRIATFALDQVGTTNWICGLFLLVVLETVPMRIDDGKKSKNSFYTEEVNEKADATSIAELIECLTVERWRGVNVCEISVSVALAFLNINSSPKH
nr:E3 ubiquitin ligase BIG BROTHER-related-like [Ipomoea batatas]